MTGATSDPADYDLAIAGGGLVGASLALALAPLGLRTAVVEAVAPGVGGHPSYDERTTALANGTVRAFQGLGVWRHMEREATPIRRIHVSEQGRFGIARIDAAEQGLESLGYVLPNRVMGAALWAGLQAVRGVEVIAPARVVSTSAGADARTLEIEQDGRSIRLRARLVVAADGARSVIREQAGIPAEQWDYGQTAIVTTVTTQRFHDHVAYERFTPDGPIAVLPLADGRCGVVWTRKPEEAARLLALPDDEFLAGLQVAFGFRLGRLLKVGARHSYDLSLTRSDRHVGTRLAIVGAAAQGLHPIAGQGFNIGMRDAACLAEVIADARAEGRTDPGDEQLLRAYADWREEDRRRIVAFTDGMVRLFGTPLGVLRGLRSVGLLAFDAFPPAKAAMARLSVGAAGRVPRLVRGMPLTGALS
ncbi:MAG: 2-octaprenyl-6-methoxyphenyl hydroxylase [Steroidobacteraceae bacterium]